ncbi:MAG: methyltransferase family protein [Gemmatimonadales bacterium]
MVSALARTIAYAAVFIGLLLVYLPSRLLSWAGVPPIKGLGGWQIAGMVVAAAGGALALWCAFTFAVVGHGTPALFDPPRRLVVRGPYHVLRNPMYLGAAIALTGAALFYESMAMAAYAAVFLLLVHALVVGYEEPTLRSKFGAEYEAYCGRVRRWWPRPGRAL